jgi:nucleoside-diphosphate-sugar epimerase
VCLSTAAVYGPGPHRGVDVDEVPPAPVSAASRTRLAAEAAFLASGACVLRAGLVLGAGDRWVVPALAELVRRVPARWDGGRGLLSVVAAADLARLIADVACSDRPWPAQVHHAAHPRPVRCGDLMRELARHGLVPEVEEKLSWEQCREQLRRSPGDVTERQFSLLAQDHWFRSDRVWRLASCDPGPGPLARLGDAAPWYRARLAGAGREAVSG